jgi:integrase
MGVKIRKRGKKWYVYIDYRGRRKSKSVGTSRKLAEQVKRLLEAKLALGDTSVFGDDKAMVPTFAAYADQWMKDYARIECKTSTADGYEGVLRQYLRPKFAPKRLNEINRDHVKALISDLVAKDLSRNTVRNAICVIRGIFNQAIEGGLLESNPAARLGRFTRTAKTAETRGVALTSAEAQQFVDSAKEVCSEYYALFLTALRAGLRRGELVALQFGDIQFGKDEDDPNRFIVVRHNYVRREHTTTKSKKSRRVDLSKELRRALLEMRDKRMLDAFLNGKNDISEDFVFPSPEGTILDPDNLYHRYFLPVLAKAGIRKIRLHDLRHTFGSLLIQNGASIVYVKEQMGHSSIQVTVDTYGHLIPGANVNWVDRLDSETSPHQSATNPQQATDDIPEDLLQTIEKFGGGEWTRTTDLRIMRPSL